MRRPSGTCVLGEGPFSLVAVLRRLVAVVLLMCGLAGLFVTASGQPLSGASGSGVVVLKLKGAIGFVSIELLDNAIARAERDRASLLVVELDTPGGLVSSTREMIQSILASRVPIAFFVAPSGARAASAGTFLLYAAHVAAMAPGTHLGAATPIPLGVPGLPGSPPQQPKPTETPKEKDPGSASDRKSLNDAIAYIRTLAQLRNRNAAWAEKAVREAATLTASEALKEKVIDVVSPSLADLLRQLEGRTVTTADGSRTLALKGSSIVEVEPDWKLRIISVIADPNIAFILLLIGFYGIIFEFMNPGTVAPGVIGSICLLLAMTALSVLPVTWAGIALLVLGILLMAGEAAAPGFGVLGIGGVVAMVLGALLLFDPGGADIPFGVSWPVIAGAVLTSVLLMVGIIGMVLKSQKEPVRTGAEELIGSRAVVLRWGPSGGQVRVHGESWTARSARALQVGEEVRVVARNDLTLQVE